MSNVNIQLMKDWVDYWSKSPEERIQILKLLGKIKCPFCGKEFDNEEDVMDHIHTEHPGEEPEYVK